MFEKPGSPLQIREEASPEPANNQILVRLLVAGVCGSDAHRLAGDISVQHKPVCFGHEAVGVIEALGVDVRLDRVGTPIAVGDQLYWMPSTPCGECHECSISNPLYCKDLNWPVPAGGPNAAGFREFATLSDRCMFIRVPEGTSPESVIAFGCAMPTALRGFEKLGKLGPDIDVVVQGSGPVGLASTLLASLAGARSIIVIGEPDHRLDVARKMGATDTLSVSNTTPQERHARVQELTHNRGAGVVIEAAGAPAAFPEGFNLLGMNGRYLILGLYSGKASTMIDPVRINNFNLQLIGSLGIEAENYARTVRLATEHGHRLRLGDLVTHRFKLQDIEEAIRTVARGESIKTVVVPQGLVAVL